jgi:hypothetical protein
VKFGDLMPHADLPSYAEYIEAWQEKHKPKYTKYECTHGSSVMTKKTDVLGREHFYLRCTICGLRIDTFKKRDRLVKMYGLAAVNDDDIVEQIRDNPLSIRNVNKTQIRAEYKRLYEEYERARSGVWWEYHRRYMESAQWKKLRAAVLERDNNQCQACGSTDTLQCHHNTYERLGAENMSDLVTLCTRCHTNHHIELDMERERERIWQENQLKINQQLLG